MGRKDRIARAATQTASQARETAAREKGRRKRTSASGVTAHRHCSVCWAPIPLRLNLRFVVIKNAKQHMERESIS